MGRFCHRFFADAECKGKRGRGSLAEAQNGLRFECEQRKPNVLPVLRT